MPANPLTACIDAWTVQAVAASRWLTRLYRVLQDDRQAATAIQAGTPAVQRMTRHGLQDRIPAIEGRFSQDHPDETQAEEAAWIALVEAQAGFSAFYAVTDSLEGKSSPELRGGRTANHAAFGKALRGFQTAFPDSMVKEGVASAVRRASATCVEAFLDTLGEGDPGRREQLRPGLAACVAEALTKAAAVA